MTTLLVKISQIKYLGTRAQKYKWILLTLLGMIRVLVAQLVKGSLLEAVAEVKPQEERIFIEGTKALANPRLKVLKSSFLKNLRLSSTTGKHLKLCKTILP